MNILVTRQSLASVIHALNKKPVLVFDCETTGLKPYHGATMFSVAISDGTDNYYFNFKEYPGLDPNLILERSWLKPLTSTLRTWVAHNAKFDLHFMDRAEIRPFGPVIDTEVLANIFSNAHKYSGGYGLDACAKRWLNMEKDDRVKEWMENNNAFTLFFNAEGRQEKNYFFDQVPFEIISTYAMKDGEITFQLYKFLTENIYENRAQEIEKNLTPVLFEMEKLGIQIDRKYCEDAYKFETNRAVKASEKLSQICGGEFTDSAKFLAPLLAQRRFVLPTTEAGNPQVTDEVLSQFPDDELAMAVTQYRESVKRATTYFSNYMGLCDSNGVIHPNFRQAGTVTGRMSCNSPNLQNIPAEDTGEFPIRRSFIPRPGFLFVSIDYKAMEFRLLLEYANEVGLIEKVKSGYDPHQAAADLTGLDRKSAKILNFGIAYRMGLAKIAKAIGCSEWDAKSFRYKYFAALPGVRRFIYNAPEVQKERGYVSNWAGRRYTLEIGKDGRDFSYKAANSIIQGGCADVVKVAMVGVHEFLIAYKTKIVLQVHDELILEVPESELSCVKKIVQIMRDSYIPKNGMGMDCAVSIGKNLCDLEEWDAGQALP